MLYQIKNTMVQIDAEDFEKVSKHKWGAYKAKKTFYAITQISGKTTYLHRYVMDETDRNVFIDHRDRDGLNCQKSNLRRCDNGQNMQNGSKRSDNTSGYKGVHKKHKCPSDKHNWRARLNYYGKVIELGYFNTPEEAARAYDKKAREVYGEFASTNFED